MFFLSENKCIDGFMQMINIYIYILTGKHGLKWVIFLNVPYFIIPISVAVSLLQERPKYKEITAEKEKEKTNWVCNL